MLDERFLQRVQRRSPGQAFDRRDRAVLILDRQSKARIDPLAVDQHRARAAGALIAAFFCAGQVKMLPQQVEQGSADIWDHVMGLAVDQKAHRTILSEWKKATAACS